MKIGILGGGFFWGNWGIQYEKIDLETPYGKPADSILTGQVGAHQIFTLQRHGQTNQFSPETIPLKANVVAFSMLEVDFIIHVTLCGALNQSFHSGDIFIFDQLIDHTKTRQYTLGAPLFDKVSHLDFSEPISKSLLKYASQAFTADSKCHIGGTMLTEEGPRFCTSAEAKMFISWGADALNMTSCPEVYLLRELGLPVLPLCLVTNTVRPHESILSESITDNAVKFKNTIPSAVKHFVEFLPVHAKIERPIVNIYDVAKFELRKAI